MTAKIIDDVLNDPTISDWLKWALRSALNRDPLDVTNDAEILFLILSQRLGELFAEQAPQNSINVCVPL
jgi:hypothetical protein